MDKNVSRGSLNKCNNKYFIYCLQPGPGRGRKKKQEVDRDSIIDEKEKPYVCECKS